ncbi:MAG TPA: 5-(carboxyamino)imidazole ribonucleotide mutase [Candidatus Butyricicoccus stercorigallinarum]|nr:5-(carboxyamino)imidazole ribonucleotide mutase [Candidatus Butyricicoccus stercorigallinarum]
MKKVCIVMGSDSDLKVMEGCINKLESFGVPFDVRIVSAHRTPAAAESLAKHAAENGYGVIIAAAGKAAHLGGVLAAYTTLPVIGVPIKSSFMDGLDSLLSMVQMPSGIPVATVAVNGADNAAILAVQMLALEDASLTEKLAQFKVSMQEKVEAKDAKIYARYAG